MAHKPRKGFAFGWLKDSPTIEKAIAPDDFVFINQYERGYHNAWIYAKAKQ